MRSERSVSPKKRPEERSKERGLPSRLASVPEGPSPLTCVGSSYGGGTYVLRIELEAGEDVPLVFGGFKGGKVVRLVPGTYLYTGSALKERGPSSPARRLVRHASRTADGPPHPIRERLKKWFVESGLVGGSLEPTPKRFKWNVDHLLDLCQAELVATLVVFGRESIEFALADLIAADPDVTVFERGLGAGDRRDGGTHLVRLDSGDPDAWWRRLPDRAVALAGSRKGSRSRSCGRRSGASDST